MAIADAMSLVLATDAFTTGRGAILDMTVNAPMKHDPNNILLGAKGETRRFRR